MLIVEGSDCVGKTTFCHKLVKALREHGPWMYRHFDPPPSLWKFPQSYFEHMSQHIVQDRFHMSEIVYSKILSRSTRLTDNAYRLIDAQHRQLGGVTVILTSDEKVIRDNYSIEELYALKTALEANQLFHTYAQYSNMDCDFTWNTHIEYPNDDFLKQVLKLYLERQELCDVC